MVESTGTWKVDGYYLAYLHLLILVGSPLLDCLMCALCHEQTEKPNLH